VKADSSEGRGGLGAPTNTRWLVVAFAVSLAVLQYVDRVCISLAGPLISKDLALSESQMGTVFAAFTLAYALFEIPGGFLGDWIGPRKVILRIVLWWSFFTAATGWVTGFLPLLVVRFLFGAGEAGCFPNISNAFKRWLPPSERSRAQGILWFSARWGGAITPLLLLALLQQVSWRSAFLIFGLVGAVWAMVFACWFRDDPRTHPQVNAAEAALLPAPTASGHDHSHVPWGAMFRSPTVWALFGQYFCLSYAWYFFVTWFPKYLLADRGFDLKGSALLSGMPLALGGLGALAAGWITPPLVRQFGLTGARRGLGFAAMAAAGLLFYASTRATNPYLAVLLISLASFAMDLTIPGSWTTCMDIGGRGVGSLSGAMNMMGNFGGVVSPWLVGIIVDRNIDRSGTPLGDLIGSLGDWNLTFLITSAICLLGAGCWLLVDPVTQLDLGGEEHATSAGASNPDPQHETPR
jgi:MFS family permease